MNHYDLLNLTHSATRREIWEAYLLAQKTYSPGSITVHTAISDSERDRMLNRIESAFHVLFDPVERQRYDRAILQGKANPTSARDPAKPIPRSLSGGVARSEKGSEHSHRLVMLSGFRNWLGRLLLAEGLHYRLYSGIYWGRQLWDYVLTHRRGLIQTHFVSLIRDRIPSAFWRVKRRPLQLTANIPSAEEGPRRPRRFSMSLREKPSKPFKVLLSGFRDVSLPFSLDPRRLLKKLTVPESAPAGSFLPKIDRRGGVEGCISPTLNCIQRIGFQRLSGTLHLRRNGDYIQFQFRRGAIEAASSSFQEYRLGALLTARHGLNSSQLKELVTSQRSKRKRKRTALGHTIVERKLLSLAELLQLLDSQILLLLKRSLEDEGRWEFSFSSDSETFKFTRPMEAAEAILKVCGDAPRGKPSEPGSRFRLATEQASLFPWAPEQIAVLSELCSAASLDELVQTTGLARENVARTLQGLLNLGVVGVADGLAPPSKKANPLTAIVPEIEGQHCRRELEVYYDEHSFFSIQFQALETRILELSCDQGLQVITVSSALPQDGKSLVTANLAYTLSKDPERKVVLLDCDLRAPTQHQIFGIPRDPGVSDYLENDSLKPHCYLRRFKQLFMMMAGTPTENPANLLSIKRMRTLIELLRADFDTILIDTPPLQPLSDTRRVLRLTDGLVLVIRRAKTPFKSIHLSLRDIDKSKLIGTVFNDVERMLFHTYYGYEYYGKENLQSKQSR